MSKVVLVGVDGREHARDAVALGAALAAATSAEVVLAHVHPHDLLASTIAYGGADAAPLGAEARALLAAAAKEAPCPVRTVPVGASSPAHGLHAAAEDLGADVIVVGSSHRAGIGRALLGSHAESVIAGAPCAVAVAPAGLADRTWSLGRISVGFDGGPEARQALARARELAEATGASLELVGVVPAVPPTMWAPYTYVPNWEEVEHAQRAALERELAACADGASTEVRVGEPAEQLEAVTARTDLLVLGSRAYGPIRRVLLGATAHRVVRHAACPVLVVPRSSAPVEAEGAPEAAATRG